MKNCTLILITHGSLARIDIRSRGFDAIEFVAMAPRSENDSFSAVIEKSLRLKEKKPKTVWLFADDFWTGNVNIAADLHSIVNEEELKQIAILESETQSLIPAFQSKIAMIRIGDSQNGDPQYWVTQFQNDYLDAIERVFLNAKVNWKGVSHPVLQSPSVRGGVLSQQDNSFANESDVCIWAKAIVKELESNALLRPFHFPPAKVMSQSTQTKWAACLAALSIAGGGYVHFQQQKAIQLIEQQSTGLAKQLDETESLNQSFQKLQVRNEEKRKQVLVATNRLQEIVDDAKRHERNQSIRSGHCLNLIDAIAWSANDDCLLQSIDANAMKTTLNGISLNEAAAHRFASRLELQPKLVGHLVSPAETYPLEGDLVGFSIVIEQLGWTTDLESSQGEVR